MSAEDYAFGIGDRVLVGTQLGVVEGQSNKRGYPDKFCVLFVEVGDNGTPHEDWFPEHYIQKARNH